MLMATAVEKIGGVTKLTANELQTVGRVAAEAAEKMRAMGGEPTARIAALAKAYEDLNEAQNSSISRIKEWIVSFVSAEAIIRGVETAFHALVGAAKEFGRIIVEGAGIADVEENFQRLNESAG